MISKREISESLALSCVESYFLAWLQRSYDVTKLYGNSFISLKQAFDDFAHGAMYQNYNYIPRLQDVAEDYGIVSHEYIPCSANEAMERLKNQDDNDLCLIRVNTAFFTDFKRSSWREDHYICVGKNLEWINQYPLSEGNFSEERFCEVFDGALCVYRLNDLSAAPFDLVSLQYSMQSFDVGDLPKSLGALESAIGILRVSRKRLVRFYENNVRVKELLQQEVSEMDKIYFDVHLRRLKEYRNEEVDKTRAYDDLYAKIVKLVEIEENISRELKDE